MVIQRKVIKIYKLLVLKDFSLKNIWERSVLYSILFNKKKLTK